MARIDIISASAGSGKTYRLAELLEEEVVSGRVRPDAIIATTFTNKAAAELQERVRTRLLGADRVDDAQRLAASRIGTVNAVCGRIVGEYAFELGLSPELSILDPGQAEHLLREALSAAMTVEERAELVVLQARVQDWDWQAEVKSVVDLARYNGIQATDLAACAKRSWETYETLLGPAATDERQLNADLQQALVDFVRGVEGGEDRTQDTGKAVAAARQALAILGKEHVPRWSLWAKLAVIKVGAKSRGLVEPLHLAAGRHDAHLRLRSDMKRCIELVFSIAERALSTYAQHKKERGVIDFGDQEALALELLRSGQADERLAGTIDLLLVDEFQDTSPIQLAIFTQLSRLAKRCVWVGDQKQSVYGFRGTDPALMDAAIDAILGDSEPETLGKSWRSRPALVDLTSELFVRAFEPHGMPPSRVKLAAALEPQKEAKDLGPVVERWILNSKNVGDDAASVAAGVKELLADPSVRVRDDGASTSRPVRAGDIALLCRTNDACKRVAVALEAIGVPAALARPGLLATYEGLALLSALRLFVDPKDSLALAHLSRITDEAGDELAWLQGLLDERGAKAFYDHPAYEAIVELRENVEAAGVLSRFDAILAAAGMRELCRRWGDTSRRLANLDSLRAQAVAYLADCDARGAGATVAGLVAYLEGLASEGTDVQSANGAGDAVSVVTWHGAKGLEWPVTVLFELEKTFGGNARGIKAVEREQAFTLDEPLAGRWIRSWPYPYGGMSKGIQLLERLKHRPEALRADEQQARQELRLLYVGWTRARDRLVLATRPKGLGKGMLEPLRGPDGEALKEPVDGQLAWGDSKVVVVERDLERADSVEQQLEPAEDAVESGPKDYPPASVQPSSLVREGKVELGAKVSIGERLVVEGRADMRAAGQALHGFFAADSAGMDEGPRREIATGLLERWGVSSHLDVDALLEASKRLRLWIEKQWPGASWRSEWPLSRRDAAGSVFRGIADLVLELDEGWVVIDHKSFPGTLDDALKRAPQYAPQLSAYALALEEATDKPVIGRYVHFPLVGACVEVKAGQGASG